MNSDRTMAVDAWEALFRAQVVVLRDLTARFPTDVLSLNEYDVLFNLTRNPQRRARIRDLTHQLMLTQPSVSRLIDRLSARGLVTRSPDPSDARGIFVQLTDAGYELFRRVGADHAQAIADRMSSALSPDELRELHALCSKLRD